ncbi:MAG TPA: redoxin domain-containing protein [Herpetosiphonaceae bacterium]
MNQLGELEDYYDVFREKGAEIVAVAQQDIFEAQATVEKTGVSFPVLADPSGAVISKFGSAPSVFILDQDGNIVWSYEGEHSDDRPSISNLLSHIP